MNFKLILIALSLVLSACNPSQETSLIGSIVDTKTLSVDAGPTLYTTASAVTSATVSSAPDLTYLWQKVSGPGAITFSNSAAKQTTVTGVAEGTHVLRLTASNADNSGTDTVSFIVDLTNPVIDAGAPLANAAAPFTPGATATDNLSPMTYLWSKQAGPGVVNFSSTTALNPTISIPTDGAYTLLLTVTDAAGNSVTDTKTVTADFTAPTVSAITDVSTNVLINKTVTVTDTNAVTYQWAKESGTGNITFSAPTALSTNITSDTDGNFVLSFTATDSFGNITKKTFNFTWDTTAPVVAVADINTNSAETPVATITELTPTTYAWTDVGATGNITFSAASAASTSVTASAEGTYTLRLTVTDQFGLTGSADFQFIWDTTKPTVDIGNTVYSGVVPHTFAPTITETNPTITYKWETLLDYSDGAVIFSDDTIVGPIASALLDGTYKVRLTVTDGAGNFGFDTTNFIVDTVAPTVDAGLDFEAAAAYSRTATTGETGSPTILWSSVSPQVTFTPTDNLTTSITSSADGSYVLTVRVTDEAGNFAEDTVNMLWDATPPVITMPADVITNTHVDLIPTVTDSTALTYQWAMQSGPGSLVFNSSTSLITNVIGTVEGDYVIELTATDALGNSSTGTMNYRYDITNPVVNAGVDAIESASYTQDSTASDDNVTITYLWSQVSGPGTATFTNTDSADPSIVADTDGDYVLKLTVTDEAGNSVSDTFSLTWDATAPVVDAGVDKVVSVATNQDATVTEPNVQTYLWTQTSGPGALTFGSPTAVDSTISANADGVYTARLTVTDTAGNTAFDEASFTWDTTAPTVNAGTDQTQNATYAHNTSTATDANGMTYLWSKSSGPGVVSFSSSTALQPSITASQDGVYVVQLTITDEAGNVASDTFGLTWDTSSPVVDAGTDKIVSVATNQDATVTDATSLTYAWTMDSGPGVITFGTPAAVDTTISASVDGVYVIRLTATDQLSNSAFDTISFTWDNTNPTVNVGADVEANALINKSPTVTDATSVTFQWAKVSGPGTVTFGASTSKDTSITASADGVYVVKLDVTDAAGNVGTDQFTLTWDATAPTVDAGIDQTRNASYTQDATVTDAGTITYQWSKVSGSGVITFGTPTAVDTTVSASADDTYVIKLTATDSVGQSNSDTFTLVWDTTNPVVDVGANETKGALFTKNTTVTDDTATTYQWTKTAGPGVITFGTPTAKDTTVSASADGTYTIQLAATDQLSQVGQDSFTLIWDASAPVVSAGADVTANAGISKTATATDSTAMTYSWTQQAGPGTITFGSSTSLTSTISADTDGTYTVRFTATDANSNSASDDFILTWDATAPIVDAGVDATAKAAVSQLATVTETNIQSYQWSKVSGPGTVTFGTPTAEDTTISADTDGTYVIKLLATDTTGLTGEDTMTLIWDTTGPVVNVGSDETVKVAVSKTPTVTDDTAVTYQWAAVPPSGNINFSASTSKDSNVSATVDGTYTIRLTATDANSNTGSDDFILVWDSTPPTVNAGGNGQYNAIHSQNATVTDATALTYQWSKQAGTGTITFGSPNSEDTTISSDTDGVFTIRLTATDATNNSNTDDITFTWDTTGPAITAMGPFSTAVPLLIDATVTDATTSVSSYAWTTVSGPGTITFDDASLQDPTVSASGTGTYVLKLTATDALGNISTENVTFDWTGAKSLSVNEKVTYFVLEEWMGADQQQACEEFGSGYDASYEWTVHDASVLCEMNGDIFKMEVTSGPVYSAPVEENCSTDTGAVCSATSLY